MFLQNLQKKIASLIDVNKPVLLGLSGGPDSLFLFYILLELKIPFSVAHIDHGWRKESADEAKILKKIVEDHQIPFHLQTLDPSLLKGNLEECCRNLRHSFFKNLCQTHHYQGVLLAHHSDDLIENVLKQFFEGVPLYGMHGINEVIDIQGLRVVRPLLDLKKEQILDWLQKQNIAAFDDSTNRDLQYLRSRMRISITPFLTQTFGKNIKEPILRKAKTAKQLEQYLYEKTKHQFIENKGPFGIYYHFPNFKELFPIEQEFIVSLIAKKFGIYLSYHQKDRIIKHLVQNDSNKKVEMHNKVMIIDRGNLFFENFYLTNNQDFKYTHTIVELANPQFVQTSNWRQALEGQLWMVIPDEQKIEWLDCKSYYSLLKKRFNNAKVPCFLRDKFPTIKDQSGRIFDFLSGRKENIKGSKKIILQFYTNKEQFESLGIEHEYSI
ncbi:MAG: tRNA lysidine(34) synthetase TilS [Chlamydia sp. 32-24]|nr:MAG: tRNA lysidine(34) synthetase TilS [Chlamydia sp. 32-24]